MVEDNQGNIWVVRESSIDRYNPKTGTTEVFGPNDFDLNMSFTEARPVHDPGTDDITVGTPMGSLTFNPAKMKKSPYQPRIVFTCTIWAKAHRNLSCIKTRWRFLQTSET